MSTSERDPSASSGPIAGPSSPPVGLVLFAPDTPARVRWGRIAFVVVMVAAALCLGWPGYLLASSAFPLVLGLPLSLAWPVGWLMVVFAALVVLFRIDHGGDRRAAGNGEERP